MRCTFAVGSRMEGRGERVSVWWGLGVGGLGVVVHRSRGVWCGMSLWC